MEPQLVFFSFLGVCLATGVSLSRFKILRSNTGLVRLARFVFGAAYIVPFTMLIGKAQLGI